MNEEVRSRAYEFIKIHQADDQENVYYSTFDADFLKIFGVPTEKINSGFEYKVKIDSHTKRIDHLLSGLLLIENKSRGTSLDSAVEQAMRYVQHLKDEDRPKFVLLSDFANMRLYDLNNLENTLEFATKDLPVNLAAFGFLLGRDPSARNNLDPVNAKAAQLLEKLHQKLIAARYPIDEANLLMTRLVFCFFADDAEIFETNQFDFYLHDTKPNGSDILEKLATLFAVLNTPEKDRFQNGAVAEFRYINGGLFRSKQPTGIDLGSEIRDILLKVSELNWSKISPVIFGSMFEGAMDPTERHNLGAHYTSEKNILKVVDSLFMEDLLAEFRQIQNDKTPNKLARLEKFHDKLANLKFLDPACGSGNFLIVAYRELRRLELDVIEEKDRYNHKANSRLDIRVDINQFYGIEIIPYACNIARLGLWLEDHLMNLEASKRFGQYFARLPLHDGGNIYCGDALKADWLHIFDKPQGDITFTELDKLDFILGNPPFIGQTVMSHEQKKNLKNAVPNNEKIGKVDFVAGWYYKATELMEENCELQVALVSTNSIAQGEQAIIVLQDLMVNYRIKINFAHQTFKWDNNGAAVFVVIIGFAKFARKRRYIFKYDKDTDDNAECTPAININQYLLDAAFVKMAPRNESISSLPRMAFGTMPRDNGNLILSSVESRKIIAKYPELSKFLHPFIGSQELLQDTEISRYILYLKNAPIKILQIPEVCKRLELTKEFRKNSVAKSTQKWAGRATELVQDQYSATKVMLLPRVSSGMRDYLPIGYYDENTIGSDQVFQVEDATLDLFAILHSKIHMSWLTTVGGRLKSDFRYSNTMVYNTFVVPEISDETCAELVASAQNILDVRAKYTVKGNSLADMYDPLLMPADLRAAHDANDKLIDSLYGLKSPSQEERVKKLMELYQKATRHEDA